MQKEKSSFRDPASQVYTDGKSIGRTIYPVYFNDYNRLMQSGLYQELVDAGLLIPHDEIAIGKDVVHIQPEFIPFISYPYEWCFSMLKEAALTTLKINQMATQHGMMLKDATAYNLQHHNGTMTLIDTTSFIQYEDGMPWGAYRQFLQHFVCPLLLMSHVNPSLNRLSSLHLDGIPLNLAAKLLPNSLHFSPAVLMHIYLQALDVNPKRQRDVRMSKTALLSLLDNLTSLVKSINYKTRSDWTQYAAAGSYTGQALVHKEFIVKDMLDVLPCGTVCDLGANLGDYAMTAEKNGNKVISIDSDHDCVERIYQSRLTLPLVVDLCNPSPAIGFNNTERKSFLDRLHVDTIMALALIHHLCIGNNTPLEMVAEMLAGHCKYLIIEFVPLEDKQAQKLLGKKNIPPYFLDIFKAEFSKYFNIKSEYKIQDSLRTIYLMVKKE